MIKSFRDDETKNIFLGKKSKKYNSIKRVVERKLKMLHGAAELRDLKSPPGNNLEELGKRDNDLKEYLCIRINDQYRLLFKWINNDCYDVHIRDYHS